MNKILLATDFSPASKNAQNYALEFCKTYRGQLSIVNAVFAQVLDPIAPAYYLEPIVNDEVTISLKTMENIKTEAQKYLEGEDLKIETITEVGLPATVIEKKAKEINAELIILGSKGDQFLSAFLGSTSLEVINRLEVPILVIPEVAAFKQYEKVIFATKLFEKDLAIIGELIDFVFPFSPVIELLHVNNTTHEDDDNQFQQFCKTVAATYPGHKFEFRTVQLKHTAEVINIFASMDKADLIVLAKHSRGFWENLFHKSIIAKEVRKSELPLLILH